MLKLFVVLLLNIPHNYFDDSTKLFLLQQNCSLHVRYEAILYTHAYIS